MAISLGSVKNVILLNPENEIANVKKARSEKGSRAGKGGGMSVATGMKILFHQTIERNPGAGTG